MHNAVPLTAVAPGKEVTLFSIEGGSGVRTRLAGMGLQPGMKVTVIHSNTHGPCISRVGTTRLVVGHGMAKKIMVKDE